MQQTFGKRGIPAQATVARPSMNRQAAPADLALEEIMESPKPKDELGKFLLIMCGGLIGLPAAAFAMYVAYAALQTFFYGTPGQQANAEIRATLTRACEIAAKQTLNYPGSYKSGWDGLGAYQVAGGWDVDLEFSATNAFGVPSDFAAACSYREAGETFRLVNVRERF